MICVDQFIILKTQKQEKVNKLFEKLDSLLARTFLVHLQILAVHGYLVCCKKNTLSQEYFYNIHKKRKRIEVEAYHVENNLLLLTQFIFSWIKFRLTLPCHSVELIVYLLLLDSRFVPWKLSEEFLA